MVWKTRALIKGLVPASGHRAAETGGYILLQMAFSVAVLNLLLFSSWIVTLRTTQVMQLRSAYERAYWLARSAAVDWIRIEAASSAPSSAVVVPQPAKGGTVAIVVTGSTLWQVSVTAHCASARATVKFVYNPATRVVSSWNDAAPTS